tara:strand:- start:3123 stop:3293 length:171 start_codon:yes stop_codon:yes gene_type:complete
MQRASAVMLCSKNAIRAKMKKMAGRKINLSFCGAVTQKNIISLYGFYFLMCSLALN